MTNHPRKTTRVMVGPVGDATAPTAADLENMTDISDAFRSPFVDDWPTPYRFLTYPGYHLGQVGQIRGPAYFPSLTGGQANDQLLTVVSESYDTATHSTRVGLVYGIVRKRAAA